MIATQASPIAMGRSAAFHQSATDALAGDPCARLHQYQQQLRAQLLAAAAAENSSRSWAPSLHLSIAPAWSGAGAVARTVESWLRHLPGVATGFADRQLAPLGSVAR